MYLGNFIASGETQCNGVFQVVLGCGWWWRCFCGMSLQVVKRNEMVASRWCWVADGGAVLSGNVIAGFHGGAVLMHDCGSRGCDQIVEA